MELRHLRYFVAVAEELHFGRAAVRLHMAQPPLSQQIRQLETEIGVTLFARTNRRVELTPAGEVFLREARAILDQVDQAVIQAQRANLGEAGWLGIGFVGSVTYDVLPATLRRFRERYPDVELVLQELMGDEQEQAIREHRIHVGFRRVGFQSTGLADAEILSEELIQEPLVVAVSSTHALATRESVALRELANEPFILFRQTASYSYGTYIVHLCQEAGFTPREVQQVDEIQTAISLISAGIGVTLVPSSVQHLRREGVIYLPLAAPTPNIGLVMAYRAGDTSPILPHFLTIAREAVRQI